MDNKKIFVLISLLAISATLHAASDNSNNKMQKTSTQDGIIAFVKNHPIKSLLCIYGIAQTSKFVETLGQSTYYFPADLNTILVGNELNLGKILARLCIKYFPSMVRNEFTIGLCTSLNGIF